ncbi:bis-aminopropyl spermidine synthase family protein [Bradyrhizobium sediminis]|uniref:Bis-aminopropyl spermidine synthase family protein n=1 Tax=Bradyrhizobium sediminis TaxID=2840469 RepID=A0A975RS94_9BRAD|nr:bis-aminopropyl spermidine synthase family protein [Bradyrhizobium sediminis]QWG17698.1 bis-aminopropyl spermidine synthase family protein [Bradyrhizobium sediminis]
MAATSILDLIAQATRLREGPSGVSAMLRAVYRGGPLRLQDAAREARLPLPVATAVRRELEKAGLLERKHGLTLTGDGRELVERDLGMSTRIDVTCATCAGHGIVIPDSLQDEVARLAEIITHAPSVDVTLDQAPCSPDTSMRRALLMLQNGALEGKRVLLLGDDDSVSIAIGLVGRALRQNDLTKADLTRGVTVIDADERRLAFLRDAAAREGLAIETVHHDLRRPLPPALRHSFDTIETDPPYTLEGARLFLARGCEALTAAADGHCFFSFAHWPPSQTLDLQKVFVELGLAVRAVWPNFNRYAGASVLGNLGQLIELVHAGKAAAELPDFSGALYTAEVNPRQRVYACAGCGKEIVLGQDGIPATIDEAKARGCSACGGHVFRRQSGRPS